MAPWIGRIQRPGGLIVKIFLNFFQPSILSLVLGMYLESTKPKTKKAEGGEKGEQVQISEFFGVGENSNFSCFSGA